MFGIFFKVFMFLLGSLFLAWEAALCHYFAPLNLWVWPPLLGISLSVFLLAVWRPKHAFSLMLFVTPWLIAVPLLATGGSTHPMHIFVMLAALAGLCWHELFEKDSIEPFCGSLGWLIWFGVVLVGVWASLSRYAPEWVVANREFLNQVVNDKEWSRITAVKYIIFNASQLVASLSLIPFAYRMAMRESEKGADNLKLVKTLWLFFAAGCTVALAAAFYQRHVSIEFCANRSFYWVRMGRINGTCQDPNALGVMLGLAFSFGLSFFSAWRPRQGYLKPALVLLWLVLCGLGINYSGSRSAFLAIALTVIFLLAGLFVNTKLILPARPLVRLGIVAVALLVLVSGAGMYSMTLVNKADKILTGTTKSPALQRRLKKDIRSIRNSGHISRIFNDSRRQLYPRFAQLTAERTWPSGVGVGSFVVELPNFARYEEENLRAPDNACNFYLQVKAETGLFGLLGLALFMGGIFFSFASSWFQGRGENEILGKLWALFTPLLVFSLLLILGVHTEVMEVSIPWHILLGAVLASLTIQSRLNVTWHGEARFMGVLFAVLVIASSFYFYRRINIGELNAERRQASIGQIGETGFYPWENWHAQSRPWRWCGKEGYLCVKKMNDWVSFNLISNYPDLEKDPQRVTVYINGESRTNVTLSTPGEACRIQLPVSYALPFDAVTEQCTAFRLECEKTWRPADYGVEGDERVLGVAMDHLRWTKEPDPEGGFYDKERTPDGLVYAWTKGEAHHEFALKKKKELKLKMMAQNPLLRHYPVSAALYINGYYLDTVVLGDRVWRTFEYDIPDDIPKRTRNFLDIIVSRQWMPRHYGFQDDRSLGVAVAMEEWQDAKPGEGEKNGGEAGE